MNHNTKTHLTRLCVYGLCAAVFFGCYQVLQAKSSPLARYPYGTEEERLVLEQNLDEDQIDYLINAQIMPQMIIPFISADGFEVRNTLYYDEALKTRQADTQEIVQFVNNYREQLDLDLMKYWLTWMDYSELAAYFNSGIETPLALNAQDLNLVLNGATTVYRYIPDDLVSTQDGILLRQEAADAWNSLVELAAQEEITLTPAAGYVSYDDQHQETEYRSFVRGPFGSREEQLGTTVAISGYSEWNQSLSEKATRENHGTAQYERAMESLEEDQKDAAIWLAENAWKEGWIIRYPQGKENTSAVSYQPFVIRYVGKEQAQLMYEQSLTLEEWNELQESQSES